MTQEKEKVKTITLYSFGRLLSIVPLSLDQYADGVGDCYHGALVQWLLLNLKKQGINQEKGRNN